MDRGVTLFATQRANLYILEIPYIRFLQRYRFAGGLKIFEQGFIAQPVMSEIRVSTLAYVDLNKEPDYECHLYLKHGVVTHIMIRVANFLLQYEREEATIKTLTRGFHKFAPISRRALVSQGNFRRSGVSVSTAD